MAEKSDFRLLWRVIRRSFSYGKLFYTALILAIVLAPLGAMRPFLINLGIDDYVLNADLSGLWTLCLVIFGLVILESVCRYFFSYTTDALGQFVTRDLRVEIFDKILGLRVRHFDQTPTGTFNTRTINDIESIKTIYSEGLLTIVADLIAIVVIIVVMLITSWQLTLACLLTLPLMVIATIIFNRKVKVAYQRVRAQLTKMNAFLQEHISGMTIIQSFNAEEREASKFRTINRAYTRANLDSVLYYAVFFPVVDIISALALGLMVWWGASGFMDESVTMGEMVVFPIYLTTLFRPIRMLADKFNSMQMGLVAAERIFHLMDDATVTEDAGHVVLEKVKGDIRFEKVNFSYVPDNPILNEVSFHIPAGQTMAIVGSTGSGKSTIINLIMRFYDYEEGSVQLDGVELKTIHKTNLRRHLSLVLQDVFLFTGTIRDNITLNNPEISDETIIRASDMLDAHRFIEQMPGSYDFVISERGNNLSSGLRQLISLVRALVYDPAVLILDEATASIDSETEEIVQYAIEKLLANRTAIIIAHRLSTIRHAHEIIVMEAGRIIERGSHDQLLEDPDSRYSELYNIQFEKEEAYDLPE